MGRIAFLFSGQGDQYPGMGKDLYENHEAARQVFSMCDELRPGTSEQCFRGTAEELKETVNTQPCLFAMELAAAAVLREKGIVPDRVAGFSLGEMVAATVAQVFDPKTACKMVILRGKIMQNAAQKFDTGMAAVVKLSAETVESLCAGFDQIYPVNYNCPGNITVSGLSSQLPGFSAAVKAAGGRALPLKVKGAFHSPFMAEAAAAFGQELAGIDLNRPQIPLYSNVTGEIYDRDPAALLSMQIESPVRWEKTIRNMLAAGIDTFVEIGPGRTLTNMVKKIEPQAKAQTFAEILEETQC